MLQNLAQVAAKIEMRPRREREREFVAGTIERLRPLADAHAAWRTAREEHQQVVLDGSRLRRRIAQAAAAAAELAAQQAAEAASMKREYDAAERLRSQFDRQANTLRGRPAHGCRRQPGAATSDDERAETMAKASEKRRSDEEVLEKAASIRVAEIAVELRRFVTVWTCSDAR